MIKNKGDIYEYVKSKKGSSISLFKRMGKDYIAFRRENGRFNGWIIKTKDSVDAVKRYIPTKVKIKVKIKGERKKRILNYSIYNKKQQKQLLYRMNKKLREIPKYQKEQKSYNLPYKKIKEDAVPFIRGKKIIDLLFDKYKFKPVIIEKYEGKS